MGAPTSEVGYNPAMPKREDHEVHKGHVVALGRGGELLSRVIACIIMKLLFVLVQIYVYCLYKHLPLHLYSYTVKTSAQSSTKQRRGFERIILHSRGVACKYYCLLGKQEWLCRYTSAHRKNTVLSPSSFYQRRR